VTGGTTANGDILALTSTVEGLDIAHTGIAFWQDGAVHQIRPGDCIIHRPDEMEHTLIAGAGGLEHLVFGTRHPTEIGWLPRSRACPAGRPAVAGRSTAGTSAAGRCAAAGTWEAAGRWAAAGRRAAAGR